MSAYLLRAKMLLDTHRPADAEREAREGLREQPEDPELLHVLGWSLLRQKRLPEARDVALSLASLEPMWENTHLLRSAVEFELENYASSERAAREALRVEPRSVHARQNLAWIYLRRQDWFSALGEAEAGLLIDPANAECTRAKALAQMHIGHIHESLDTATSTLRLNPENAESQRIAGWAKLNAGEHDEALEHFVEAARLAPGSAMARSGILIALRRKNPIFRLLGIFKGVTAKQVQLCIILPIVITYFALPNVDLFRFGMYAFLYIFGLYIFVMMFDPLLDIPLLFNRRFRVILDDDQRSAAAICLFFLVLTTGWLFTGFFFHRVPIYWSVAIFFCACPFTQMFHKRQSWRKITGFALNAALGVLLLIGLCFSNTEGDTAPLLFVATVCSAIPLMFSAKYLDK